MNYCSMAVVFTLTFFLPQAVLANGGLHGNRLSGSMGTLIGDLKIDDEEPDTAFDFDVRLDHFVDPETYLLGQLNHRVLAYSFDPDTELTQSMTYFGFGVGREIVVTSMAAFYAEASVGLGWGKAETISPGAADIAAIEGNKLDFGLGFRGTLGRDQWSIGAEVNSTRLYAEEDSDLEDSNEITFSLNGSALVRLTDPMLLGPYFRLNRDTSQLGLTLRLTGW